MKNKQNTKPTKKRILMYYLILAACLLVIAAVTVGIVFGMRNNAGNPTIDGSQTEKPDDKDPGDKDPITDTSTQYEFISPVKTINVSQAHVLWHDKTLDRYCLHKGMDFACEAGTEVLAAVDGTVKSVFVNSRLYGATVTIEHAGGVTTVYKYIDPSATLKAGDKVQRGDTIGTVAAATGAENKEGDHLHFEVYKNTEMQDPDIYLKLISK